MDESLGRLNDQLDLFIGAFLTLGLDYHIGVVTTDMETATQAGKLQGSPTYIESTTPDPVGKFESRASVGSGGSADERGFDAAKAALTDPLLSAENAGFLRTDSTLSVIVLSDENDASSQTASKFVSWFESLRTDPDKTTFNAFVGDRGFGCTGGDIWAGDFIEATGGDKYIDAADATGGFFASICSDDFSSPVINMARSSAGMKSTFTLTETPSDVSRLEVVVDGADCPADAIDGYSYDATSNSITFHGSWFPDANAVIEVAYPVDESCNSPGSTGASEGNEKARSSASSGQRASAAWWRRSASARRPCATSRSTSRSASRAVAGWGPSSARLRRRTSTSRPPSSRSREITSGTRRRRPSARQRSAKTMRPSRLSCTLAKTAFSSASRSAPRRRPAVRKRRRAALVWALRRMEGAARARSSTKARGQTQWGTTPSEAPMIALTS
jgi:hypothetical protein